ncbi:TadG [Vibrio coralliilyticus]|uniref:TadG n=1 Tax=Vibrio coralliilyticus TaxID=190893 RepID=UPI00345ED281
MHHKQQGHASILFAMLIPLLFGVFALGSDGARAIQSKARIEDASEAAALALSARDDEHAMSDENKTIVQAYIEEYLPVEDSDVTILGIERLECDDMPECRQGSGRGDARYTQYSVRVSADQTPWFGGGSPEVEVPEVWRSQGGAKARKYQSNAVDIVFAADFSGSMASPWTGGSQPKYRDLIDILEKVTVELAPYNFDSQRYNSSVGVSGFNALTYRNELCAVNNLEKQGLLGVVDYSRTVARMWETKSCRPPSISNSAGFHDVPLTDDYSTFNRTVDRFTARGGTASYQAVMSGARLLDHGSNNRQILIVISDGQDNNLNHTNGLVNAGMCRDIISRLEGRPSANGRDVSARLAFIGFDFEPSMNPAMVRCVGEDNVFKAENTDELFEQIMFLIREEVGHLATRRD